MNEPVVPSFGESVRLPKTPREPRLSRGQIIFGAYVLLSAVAVGIGVVRGAPNLLQHPERPPLHVMSLLAGVAAGFALVALSRWSVARFAWARVLHTEFRSVIVGLPTREIWLLAFSSSIAEELFFRGALLPWLGLVFSSIFFAALHVRLDRRFLPWTVMSLIVGLMLGGLFIGTGSLLGPIICHFVINLLNLKFIARTELSV